MPQEEGYSKSYYRKLYRKQASEGRFMLVCPLCHDVITELHKWSVRHDCCRAHVEVFPLNGQPTSERRIKFETLDKRQFHDLDKLRPRGAVTSRAAFHRGLELVDKWETLYETVLFMSPELYCPHCKLEGVEGVLYRNYVGCEDCVPKEKIGRAANAMSYLMRKQAVGDCIERLVMNSPDVAHCTNPEKIAVKVRRFVYSAWIDSLAIKYGRPIGPRAIFLNKNVKLAWKSGLCAQRMDIPR